MFFSHFFSHFFSFFPSLWPLLSSPLQLHEASTGPFATRGPDQHRTHRVVHNGSTALCDSTNPDSKCRSSRLSRVRVGVGSLLPPSSCNPGQMRKFMPTVLSKQRTIHKNSTAANFNIIGNINSRRCLFIDIDRLAVHTEELAWILLIALSSSLEHLTTIQANQLKT